MIEKRVYHIYSAAPNVVYFHFSPVEYRILGVASLQLYLRYSRMLRLYGCTLRLKKHRVPPPPTMAEPYKVTAAPPPLPSFVGFPNHLTAPAVGFARSCGRPCDAAKFDRCKVLVCCHFVRREV
eukprot:COSAG01_NODE_1945_length_8831_cov_4.250000_12_plen_124_part_00